MIDHYCCVVITSLTWGSFSLRPFFLVAKLCMKWQVDELVVQAFKLKSTSKQGRIEIESFTHFLSEMLSSLKVNPTVPTIGISHFHFHTFSF